MKCINKIILWIVIWFSLSLTGCGNNAENLQNLEKNNLKNMIIKLKVEY